MEGTDKKTLRAAGWGVVRYVLAALRWAAVAILIGSVCGLLGAGFHEAIDWATGFRMANGWSVRFLPAAGLATLALYQL